MKKSLIALAAVAGFSAAAVPSVAQAQLSTEVGAAAVSSYAWRGQQLADAFVIQPSVTFGVGDSGLSFGAWGSWALEDREMWDFADELDIWASYDMALGESGTGLTVGFTEYIFLNVDGDGSHSEEAFASLSFDAPLSPSVSAYYDFGVLNGFYLSGSIGHDIPLGTSEAAVLSLGASVGLSSYDWGDDDDDNDLEGIDLGASAALGFALGGATVSPFVGFSFADESIYFDETQFWGGVSVSFGL